MRRIKIDDFIVDKQGTSGFVNSIDYDHDTHQEFVEIYLYPEDMRGKRSDDAWATIYTDDIEDVYRTKFDPKFWKGVASSYVQLAVEKVPDFSIVTGEVK